jgi:hypothetical protein
LVGWFEDGLLADPALEHNWFTIEPF